jgi:hypothetical protein
MHVQQAGQIDVLLPGCLGSILTRRSLRHQIKDGKAESVNP